MMEGREVERAPCAGIAQVSSPFKVQTVSLYFFAAKTRSRAGIQVVFSVWTMLRQATLYFDLSRRRLHATQLYLRVSRS